MSMCVSSQCNLSFPVNRQLQNDDKQLVSCNGLCLALPRTGPISSVSQRFGIECLLTYHVSCSSCRICLQ